MAKILTLRCPACEGSFDYFSHPEYNADTGETVPDPGPQFCPKCGYDTTDTELDLAPVAPRIGTLRGKIADKMYREAERGAEFRAEMAGDPSLKITDMRTARHEGETAAMPVSNDVTKAMEAPAAQVVPGMQSWGQQNNAAAAMSAAAMAHQGPDAHAGLRAMSRIREGHAAKTADHRGVSSTIVTKEIHDRQQFARPAPRGMAAGFRGR